ncbi:hypothetical protein BJX70DRAFT_357527 [Aspergillus crustosus]
MAGPQQTDYIAPEFPPAVLEKDRLQHPESVFYKETDIKTSTAINPTDTRKGINFLKKAAKWRPYVLILVILIIIIITVVVAITLTQKKTTATHKTSSHKTSSHLI